MSLAHGLVSAYLFNEKAGWRIHDVLGRNHGLREGAQAGAGFSWDAFGLYGDNSSGALDLRVRLASDPLIGANAITIAVGVRLKADSASRGIAGAWADNSNTSALLFLGSDNKVYFRVNGSVGGQALSATTVPTSVPLPFTAVGVYSRSAAFSHTLYIDGVTSHENGADQGAVGVGTPPAFDLMQYGGISGTSMFGTMQWCYLWTRALNREEVRSLHDAPYQMFAPVRRRAMALVPIVEEEEAFGISRARLANLTMVAGGSRSRASVVNSGGF